MYTETPCFGEREIMLSIGKPKGRSIMISNVLVRINGLKKSPKVPRNTFFDALLKSRFQKFARFFGGSHRKK